MRYKRHITSAIAIETFFSDVTNLAGSPDKTLIYKNGVLNLCRVPAIPTAGTILSLGVGKNEVTPKEPQVSCRFWKPASRTLPTPSGMVGGSQVDPKVNMWKKSSVLGLAHCHLPFLELSHVFQSLAHSLLQDCFRKIAPVALQLPLQLCQSLSAPRQTAQITDDSWDAKMSSLSNQAPHLPRIGVCSVGGNSHSLSNY